MEPLAHDDFGALDADFRAANFLTVAHGYFLENPASWLRECAATLRVRVVNIVQLMTLFTPRWDGA